MVLPSCAHVTLYPNVLQSQDERPLQKPPTLSIAELMTVFSSGFVLWCDCRTLFTFQDAFLEPFFEAVAVDGGWNDAVYGAVGFVVEVDDGLAVG